MLQALKKIFSTHFWLIFIVALGFFLRVWQLAAVPAILNRDEAALAYNALLLKETGTDEWQRAWPLALESFGDYKLPGYIWGLVASFSVFGYHDWVVKVPSVLAGTGLIVLTYFYFTQVFRQSRLTGWIAAFLVAVTPVFFFYSRIAFEANVGLFLLLLGMWCLLREPGRASKRPQSSAALLLLKLAGIASLLLAVFTYNTPLLLLPFLVPVVVIWRGILKPQRWLLPVLGMLVVTVIGFASLLSLSHQKSGITIFADENVWLASVQYHDQFSGLAQKLLGNKVVFFGQVILKNLIASFSPYFLVFHGGEHPWHTLPGFGHFYLVVYGVAIVGMIASVWLGWKKVTQKKKNLAVGKRLHTPSLVQILSGWWLLLASVIPAAITVDAPHATRSLAFFWLWLIFATFGFQTLWRISRQKIFMRLVIIFLVILLLIEVGQYLQQYFGVYGIQSQHILEGQYQAVLEKAEQHPDLKTVAVVDGGGYQYILTAWYLKMSPSEFFTTIQRHLPDRIGFRYGYKVGKYRFIVAAADRFPEEKALIEWDDANTLWQLHTGY